MVDSRYKGKRFESDMARELREIYPNAWRSYGQARQGKDAADIEGTPWRIECKTGKRVNPLAAFNQVVEDGKDDPRPPLVITRTTGGPVLVTMGIKEFKDLIRSAPDRG